MEKFKIEEKIVAMLKTVYDPEIPVNVYDLGLIYKIDVSDNGEAVLDMTLTAPNCPAADFIMEASCSTMKVLVSSMECPRISAQRTGAMKRTKLNGSFFVITVATTMRIRINAMIKVAFINKSFRYLLKYAF